MEIVLWVVCGVALCACVFAVFFAWWSWRQARAVLQSTARTSTPESSSARRRLRVLEEICRDCDNFDLKAGQAIREAHPAFHAATAHLQPFQMSGLREEVFEDNPEYLETEKAMQEAADRGDLELNRALHTKLLTLDPGVKTTKPKVIDPAIRNLSWKDLGLCGLNQDLRFSSDKCEKWEGRRTEEVS